MGDATRDNVANYRELVESGLGSLLYLGCEVFGRGADDVVRIVPALAAENARSLPPLVLRGATQALAARCWELLAVATQRLMARAVLRDASANLVTTLLEDPVGLADLPNAQRINPSEFAACMQALSPDARNIRQDDLRAQARGPHRTSHAPREAHYRTAAQPRGAGCRKHA